MDRNIDELKMLAKTWHDRATLSPESERAEASMGAMTILLVWWINKVRPGGDWDYKRMDPKEFEEFGNFNFGATASALEIPYYISESGGGVINLSSNVITMVERLFRNFVQGDQTQLPTWWSEGIPFLRWPFGDDSKDARQVQAGYAFYDAKMKGDCK